MSEVNRLTYWDMAQKLKELSKFLENIPSSVIRSADSEMEDAMAGCEQRILAALKKLGEFQSQFDAVSMDVYKGSDEAWRRINEARETFNKRLQGLAWPQPNFAYGIEETIKLSERCSHLTDEQWKRVVELAHAFAQKQ
jgi:hypothetical protein